MSYSLPCKYYYRYVSGYNLHRYNWSPETLSVRQKILDFKDGINQRWAQNLVINSLYPNLNKYLNLCFVCLPASTTDHNELRWKSFSENICNTLKISNGFPHIRIVKDGTPKHLSKTHTQIAPEIEIDQDFFQNKNILLFDDIVTTSQTGNNFACQFKNRDGILGLLALARTLYIQNEIDLQATHNINNHPVIGDMYIFEEASLAITN